MADDTSDKQDTDLDAPPLKPFSKKGTHSPAKSPSAGYRPEPARRVVDLPGYSRRPVAGGTGEEAKKLFVGKEINLSGEIRECETLVVEGTVEAALSDARSIEILESGLFKGAAEVDDAEISGRFDGELTVRNRLLVRVGGQVLGTIHYGEIVIEAGGEVSGQIKKIASSAERDD
tara:strand:+ start:761 stop:1285 length:525 start_codon:yes stop_codon:yes gene_type:complete